MDEEECEDLSLVSVIRRRGPEFLPGRYQINANINPRIYCDVLEAVFCGKRLLDFAVCLEAANMYICIYDGGGSGVVKVSVI